jgi:hypothetical protein
MMHFFKRKKLILECFTDKKELITDAPIDKAFKYMPEWWKTLPKPYVKLGDMNADLNMRHCPGIVELYKHSFIIPLWSDLKISMGANTNEPYEYRWQFSDGRSGIEVHSATQRGVYLPNKNYQHLKLNTPWALQTNKDVMFTWFGATWNMDNPENIIIPPGIDEYYQQHSTTINMFIPRSANTKEFILPFRQPLVFITPITKEKVYIKHSLVSTEEFAKIQRSGNYRPKFFNSYYNIKKVRNK